MINYQLKTNEIIEDIKKKSGEKPALLLHSCCGPCSSYVIEYLCEFFKISVFYYNPNIFPDAEYIKRKNEQLRLIGEFNKLGKNIDFIDCDYNHDEFLNVAKGFENEKEGGERCHRCYEFRLLKTAKAAKEKNFDFFATTLTVSPYKNAQVLNELGEKISTQTGIKYLYSDFKKLNGYKRSIELSKQYDLYRQIYCGCEFSLNTEN